MLIGYARISKADGSQSLDLQRDALREAGVSDDAIYQDQASGQREDRPGPRRLPQGGAAGRRDRRLEARSPRSQSPPSRQPGARPQRQGHRDPGARRTRGQHRHDDGQRKVGLRALRGFGGIRTRADPGTDPRWIGLCTSQGQEGRAPSRAEQSAGAASSGSDGAARHEGQRAMPRARRNQGDDLPLRSARWFLEKPRATGPGSLGGPKSGP